MLINFISGDNLIFAKPGRFNLPQLSNHAEEGVDKSDEITRKAQIENDENLISSNNPLKKAEEDSSELRGAKVNQFMDCVK